MNALFNLDAQYFVYRVCPPGWRLEKHIMPIHGLILVLSGTARYRIDGRRYSVQGGDLVYFHPGCLREVSSNDMVCVAFDFTLRQGDFRLPTVSRFQATEELHRLIREFEYEWLQKNEGYAFKCNALLLLVLYQLLHARQDTAANYHVEKMKRYIINHFAEPLQVKDLAAMLGLNPVYCGALFRKAQGLSIAEYANQIRVSRAAALLEEGGYTLAQAASLCGFNDVYYFSKTFKQVIGMPPGKYRGLRRKS